MLRPLFRPAFFLAAALGLFAPACSSDNDCSQGETRCDGHRILGCPTDYITSRTFEVPAGDCPDAQCVDTKSNGVRRAACSTSGAIDPRCAGYTRATCLDANTFLFCDLGYSSQEQSCSCVTGFGGYAFCALAPTVDPKCHGESVCDGNTIVECNEGYATKRTNCEGEAPLCVRQSNGAHNAFCAKEATCAGEDGTTCSQDKSHAEGCVSGHVVSSACAPGKHCSVYDIGRTHEVRCIQ